MGAKKVVMYEEQLMPPVVGRRGHLVGVQNHYRLGTAPVVYTSYIIDIRDEGNTIETQNTIYKKL